MPKITIAIEAASPTLDYATWLEWADNFDRRCRESEYTDTDEAWNLIDEARRMIRRTLEENSA